jgi:pimeloyl-ACP methyl ester carboxylesterase
VLVPDHVEVRGVRVRHVAAGAGPPLLFLHGWGASLDGFAALLAAFAPTRTVHAFDFPGFGQSGLPPEPWSVADFAALTRDLLARLGVERPDVVAHSFGGRVAIRLAAEQPDALGRLVLIGVPGVRRRPTPRDRAKRTLARSARWAAAYCGPVGERLRRSIYGLIASPDYAAAGPLRATFVRVVGEDLRPLLPRVRSRALLVWGERDLEVPLEVARAMEAAMPDARLVVVPRAGHFAHLDQPDFVRLLLARFLRA